MTPKPTPRPRTKPPDQRRDDLLNAAQRLFIKQGIGPTSVEQITAAADVAKGTFYLHFASKDEIHTALEARFAQQLLAKIAAAIAKQAPDDWPAKLGTWAATGLGAYLESIRLHDALFYGSRPATREGLVDNIVIDHLVELLQAGAAAGAWSVDDAHFTAVFLFSGFHGIVDDAYDKGKRINQPQLTQRLQRVCFRAVGLQR
jgi:AcrR family transcriptional regulator